MIILDTGPLVAFLSERDNHYAWAYQQFEQHPFPFITCESVISETLFFLQKESMEPKKLYGFMTSCAIEIALEFRAEIDPILKRTQKYKDLPMDLADACLVRMAELHSNSQILTIDSDFNVYRQYRNKALDVIMPE